MSNEASGSGVSRPRRHHKEQPLWTPKDNLLRDRETVASQVKDDPASENIVEGLLEIVNMITDNPGLKNDLQEYFQETRKTATPKRRRQLRQNTKKNCKSDKSKAKKVETEKLDDLIRDYRELIVKQKSEEATSTSDIDGEALPIVEELQGFKKTFTTVDSYQELPMDLDSGDDNEAADSQDFPFPGDKPTDPRLNKNLSLSRDGLSHQKISTESPMLRTQLFGELKEPDFSRKQESDWNFPAQTFQTQNYVPRPQPGPPRLPPPHSFRQHPSAHMPQHAPLQNIQRPYPAFPPFPPIDPFSAPFTQTYHIPTDQNTAPPHFTPNNFMPHDQILQQVEQFVGYPLQQYPPLPPPPQTPEPAPPPPADESMVPQNVTSSENNESGPTYFPPDLPPLSLHKPKELFVISSDSSGDESYAEDSVPSEDSLSLDLDTPDEEEVPNSQNKKQKHGNGERYQDETQIDNQIDKTQKVLKEQDEAPMSDEPAGSASESSSGSSSSNDSDSLISENETVAQHQKKSSDDEDINNKYNLEDVDGEGGNEEPHEKQDEDEAEALRSLLLNSIKTQKASAKSPVAKERDQNNLGAAVATKEDHSDVENKQLDDMSQDTNQLKSEIPVVEDDNEEPFIKRVSKRKKCRPSFAINDILDIVKVLPEVDEASFRTFYKTKRQQKRARVRARQSRVGPLEILKQELYFDPEVNEWLIHNDVNNKLPAHVYSFVRLSKFLGTSSNRIATADKNDKSLEEKQILRKKRLQTFFQLSEKVQNVDKPAAPEKTISPKEIKITIQQEIDTPVEEMDVQMVSEDVRFKSTFKETEASELETIIEEPKQPAVQKAGKRIKKIIVRGSKSLKTAAKPQEQQNKEKDLDSGDKQSDIELRVDRRRTTSEDDLDSMRELLLQSMIKKAAREADKPQALPKKTVEIPLPVEKKSILPLVQLKTRDNSNTSSPRTSPSRDLASDVTREMEPRQLVVNEQRQQLATALANTTLAANSTYPATDPIPAVVLVKSMQLGDELESLMPRSLDSLTPEAIKRSNDNTKKMISRLLVDVDLRLPQKDSKLSAEAHAEKEKLLKRITPKVKPMVITLGNTESESESDVTPTTPVKTPFPTPNKPGDIRTVKLNSQRSNLTYQIAQLEQRLVQYSHKRNQQQEEHVRHAEKVKSFTAQLARAREIVRKSAEIMKSLDLRKSACLNELRVKGSKLQDLQLRINNPELWEESQRLQKLQESRAAELRASVLPTSNESTLSKPPLTQHSSTIPPTSNESTHSKPPLTQNSSTIPPSCLPSSNEPNSNKPYLTKPHLEKQFLIEAVPNGASLTELKASEQSADTSHLPETFSSTKSQVNTVNNSNVGSFEMEGVVSYMESSTPVTIAATAPVTMTIINVPETNNKTESSSEELEPGELASDTSSKRGSEVGKEEEEGQATQDEVLSSSEDEQPDKALSVESTVLSSVTSLLEYCKPLLVLKPLPRPESLHKPNIEFKRIPPRKDNPDCVLLPSIKFSSYKSPLTVFRSYRFSPYYRIKSQFNLTSSTFSHNIRPAVPICPHDLHGKCFDKACTRQHLSLVTKASGPHLRTQLCISAGVSMSEVKQFETNHKNLSEEDMNILFCAHLNSLREERGREYHYVNTIHSPPTFYSTYSSSDSTKLKDKLAHYNSLDASASQPTKYDKIAVTRYCNSMSEVTLTQQCKANPKMVGSWLDLAQCQAARGADVGVVIGTLSKALQANKHSPELWSEYLRVKSAVVSVSTLRGLYTQALKLAPSPVLWRNLAPKLITLPERLEALDSAIQICDMSKAVDKDCYGELLKDKLFLIHFSGQPTNQQFHDIFEDMTKLTDTRLVWFVQQYISLQQSGTVLDNPSLVVVQDNISISLIPDILAIISRAVEFVTEMAHLLTLHRLFAVLLAKKGGTEEAINYLSEVTETRPDIFELMEDIIELGGWVEPDVPWPKLTYLQMQAAIEKEHPEMALSFSRELVRILSGVSSENTVQLYREVLGVTIGARVKSDYSTLSQGLHRTWLYLCYGLVAHMSPPDPVLQYKLYSTRLANVFPSSEQLNALRYGISVEPTTKGAQILWNRYLHELEVEASKDLLLVDVLHSEMAYCLKSVPTVSSGDFSFHNEVLSKLLSHCSTLDDKFREASSFLLSYRKNKQLLIRYSDMLSQCNPLSTVQLIRELLKDNPTCPTLWSKLVSVSERCRSVTETRLLLREAVTTLPLNSSLLLQAVVFEVRYMKDPKDQEEFCSWALSRAEEKGIVLKPTTYL